MKMKQRLLGLAVAITTVLSGAVLLGAQPAYALTDSQMQSIARGACGSGYSVVHKTALSTAGTMYLLYAGGYNCAVNVKNSTAGSYHTTSINMERQSDYASKHQSGSFKTYAGPIYLSAPNQCVKYWGSIVTSSRDYLGSSGWVACS